jgi:hypothetical protein
MDGPPPVRRGAVRPLLVNVARSIEQGGMMRPDGRCEHARAASFQRRRSDPRVLEGLPRELQREPLLGVHAARLARRDAEEERIEAVNLLQSRQKASGLGDPGNLQAIPITAMGSS